MRRHLAFLSLLVSVNALADSSSLDLATRYDDGARWAFVTDAASSNVAVIDTFNFSYQDSIALKAVPTAIVVSDVQDTLVYIDGKTNQLYIYDLVTKNHSVMATSALPKSIAFHADGAQLAVVFEHSIDIVKPYEHKHVASIQGLNPPISINFDNGGYNLYITEHKTGNTLIYRNHDGKKQQLSLAKGDVSELTLSPDTRLAMLSDYDNNSVTVWDLSMDKVQKSYSMQSKPWRPYVSSDSEHMIFSSENGHTQVINTWTQQVVKEFNIGGKPASIRTGWLESIGIIETDSSLSVFDLNDNAAPVNLPLKHKLQEVVVVSDSKTLFATQANSSALLIYDIRDNKLKSPIDTKLTQPKHLVMGITNTVCH